MWYASAVLTASKSMRIMPLIGMTVHLLSINPTQSPGAHLLPRNFVTDIIVGRTVHLRSTVGAVIWRSVIPLFCGISIVTKWTIIVPHAKRKVFNPHSMPYFHHIGLVFEIKARLV